LRLVALLQPRLNNRWTSARDDRQRVVGLYLRTCRPLSYACDTNKERRIFTIESGEIFHGATRLEEEGYITEQPLPAVHARKRIDQKLAAATEISPA
jgi:hypothetical protein